MVQRIEDLKFQYHTKPINNDGLELIKALPFEVPRIYIQLLLKHNGGYLNYDFEYYDIDMKKVIKTGISSISGTDPEDCDNLIKGYYDPADMFPENILAFSVTGNGDKICFDYREDSNTNNPPVVYWNHEADLGKDVSFVAKDFESFLGVLEEPSE